MNTTGERHRASCERIPLRHGAFYFLDSDGYVAAVPKLGVPATKSKVMEALKKDAAKLRRTPTQREIRHELHVLLRGPGPITTNDLAALTRRFANAKSD